MTVHQPRRLHWDVRPVRPVVCVRGGSAPAVGFRRGIRRGAVGCGIVRILGVRRRGDPGPANRRAPSTEETRMTPRILVALCVGLLSATQTGCVSESSCTNEFVSGNESCAPGCDGITVQRTAHCVWSGEELTWCVQPASSWRPEDVPCIVDTSTGDTYRSNLYPESLPSNVRYCTEEEEALLSDFSGCS